MRKLSALCVQCCGGHWIQHSVRLKSIQRTYYYCIFLHAGESKGAEPTPEQIELRLIQSKSEIEHPPDISSLNDN